MLMASCTEGDPPIPPWTEDVQVTGYKWDELPKKIEVEAGYSLDLTLSFKWSREAGMMGDRPVRPPAEWPVAAEVLTKGGDLAVVHAINSPAREFYDAASRIGTQRLLSDNSLVWVSPDPPENLHTGRRYLWGHVEMPREPGTYRLVVNVYPTVRFAEDSNPDYGPAEELYSVDVHVKPASKPPPAVMSQGQPSTPANRFSIDRERDRLGAQPL
jgi:hypothetical protein